LEPIFDALGAPQSVDESLSELSPHISQVDKAIGKYAGGDGKERGCATGQE
jgi:hypothetical protein